MTAVEVQRGLKELYGWDEAGHGSSQTSDFRLLGSGYETDVFAFSLAPGFEGTEEARDLVLRVYAGEGASEKSEREFAAMRRLRAAGYPVPRVLRLQRDRSPLGQPFVIMERIDGVSLGASFWSAPDDQRPGFQALLYRLMAELHALEGSAILPESPLAGSRAPYGFIDHELSHLSSLLDRLQGREPASLRDTLAWLIARRSDVPCERLAVVHGDFHPNNVLVRADGLPFVIDWSNVHLADFRSDLAWTRLLTSIPAQPDPAKADLRVYERLAGKPVAMIEYFEVIACTRLLSSVLISLRFGAARQGMRPGAEALMQQNADGTKSVAALLQERIGRTMPDLDDALSALLK